MSALSRRMGMKRAFDTALILVFSPFIGLAMLIAAVAVRISMGTPVVFRQHRIGRGEEPFMVLKFRTMSDERDASGTPLPDDQRITRTGRVLRKLSLDELPQLINVLRGEMSLVGPRPLLVDYVPYYRERERLRHRVRPGITGAAQVAGRNGLLWDARLAIDADYVESGTILTDFRIIAATIRGVFAADGVSVVASDSGERLDVLRSYPADGDVALRRLELDDVEVRVAWFGDKRVSARMNIPKDITVSKTRDWVLASRKIEGRHDFVVYDVRSGDPLAMLGVRPGNDPATPEVHVLVAPERHGQGFGSRSMRLLLAWMRQQPGIVGCWLTVHPENLAARRLYERLGFLQIGEETDNRITMQMLWGGK